MVNIPGIPSTALPDVYSRVVSQGAGVATPVGGRVACLVGLGSRTETIIAAALGGGQDGLNSSYTSTVGADGRHFILTQAPIVSNRTTLFLNGIPLVGLEQTPSDSSFSNAYNYRIDIATGHIEMQKAFLVDQGGSFYTASATNVGIGTLQNLTLVDVNAPSETWTIKCVSVQRNNLNQPIAGTATFTAFGSVSGQVLDENGNPVVWVANNTVASNTILSFSILETQNNSNVTISPFRQGDSFTVQVGSGVLSKNDTLTATYIAVGDINTPVFFDNIKDITTKHGASSLNNTLALGAFLFFAQTPPGAIFLEAAPSLPRRTSYVLETNFPATSTNCNDFILPLPLGVEPDINSQIHFFVTNPTTGVETQLLPNKFPFFTLGESGQPTVCTFVTDNLNPPAGNSFSYSVIEQIATLNFAQDGYLNRSLTTEINATFSSASVTFNSSYVGKELNIIDSNNTSNIGTFSITSVANGVATITATGTPPFADFTNETSVGFELVDGVFFQPVPSTSGSDGTLVAVANTATGTFHSTAINFNTFTPIANGYKLKITSSAHGNTGLYDITAYNSGSNTLTIAKSFISESGLKFEVLDPSQESFYIVVNHNIVPNGNTLRVTIVDARDASFFDAGWEQALAQLETIECDMLVPLPQQTISAIFQNFKEHCITMSGPLTKKERVLLIGAINGLTPDNVLGNTLAAVESLGILEGIHGDTVAEILAGDTEDLANYSVPNAYGDTFRVEYFYPDQIVVEVGGQNTIIDGFYLGAAAAGFYTANTQVAVPLTHKTLSGFTILSNRQFRPTVLQNLAAAGITVLQPIAGGGEVIWGKSTTQSGFISEIEMSVVFIRDKIAKTMRAGLKGFIGNPQDPNIIGTILARSKSMLDGFISQLLITDYTDLTVKQDPVDPTQVDVTVTVAPTLPLNFIYIEIDISV